MNSMNVYECLLPLKSSALFSKQSSTPSAAWVLGILAQATNGKVKFSKLDTKRGPLVPAAGAAESDSDSPRNAEKATGAQERAFKHIVT